MIESLKMKDGSEFQINCSIKKPVLRIKFRLHGNEYYLARSRNGLTHIYGMLDKETENLVCCKRRTDWVNKICGKVALNKKDKKVFADEFLSIWYRGTLLSMNELVSCGSVHIGDLI